MKTMKTLADIPPKKAYQLLLNGLTENIFNQATVEINREYRQLFKTYERNELFQISITNLNSIKAKGEKQYQLFKKQYKKQINDMLFFPYLAHSIGLKRNALKHDKNLLKENKNHTLITTEYVDKDNHVTLDSVYHLRPQVVYLTFIQGLQIKLSTQQSAKKLKQINEAILKSLGNAVTENLSRMLVFYYKQLDDKQFNQEQLVNLLPIKYKIKTTDNLLHILIVFKDNELVTASLPKIISIINDNTSLTAHLDTDTHNALQIDLL